MNLYHEISEVSFSQRNRIAGTEVVPYLRVALLLFYMAMKI